MCTSLYIHKNFFMREATLLIMQYEINIACVDGVRPLEYQNVPVGNGELNDTLPPLSN